MHWTAFFPKNLSVDKNLLRSIDFLECIAVHVALQGPLCIICTFEEQDAPSSSFLADFIEE